MGRYYDENKSQIHKHKPETVTKPNKLVTCLWLKAKAQTVKRNRTNMIRNSKIATFPGQCAHEWN